MLNTGRGFSDEFEDEVIRFQEAQNNNSKLKQQYAQISSSVKKEGGALVKAVRSKVINRQKVKLYLQVMDRKGWLTTGTEKN